MISDGTFKIVNLWLFAGHVKFVFADDLDGYFLKGSLLNTFQTRRRHVYRGDDIFYMYVRVIKIDTDDPTAAMAVTSERYASVVTAVTNDWATAAGQWAER